MTRIGVLIVSAILLWSCQAQEQSTNQLPENVSTEKTISRIVKDNRLVSDSLPAIIIEVAEEFQYIGEFPFDIIAASEEYPKELQGKPVAAGDRYVFAALDDQQVVEKLFIVQLEGFLPENDYIFNYNFDRAETIGANKYRHNTWFYDSKKLAEENPHNEGAKTRKFLMDKGLILEDQYMMSRFVGLASEDRKNEIIIFYIEMLQPTTGYTLEEYEQSLKEEQRKAIRSSFVERSRQSFRIVEG